ncbi:MAG: hypothetical protein Kow00105_00270 [Phycisphaeraceae bacterium]
MSKTRHGHLAGRGLIRTCCVTAAVIIGLAGAPSTACADTFHGINAGAVIWNGQILLTQQKANAIAATGTNALRVNFRLDGNPTWNASLLSQYDQIIANATNAGLEVLGLWSNETVYAGQDIWNDDPTGTGLNSYVNDFAQNALLLADRYKDTIKVWEVTNEPNAWATADPAYNDPRFVGGTYILPSVYANILAETYKQLNFYNGRRLLDDYNIRLMTGGLLAHDIGGSFSTAMPYMQQVFDQDHVWNAFQNDTGRAYPWDLFGYHFYISQGSLVPTSQLQSYFNNVRATQAANGDPSDIVVTEWGWQTVGTNTQELQRDNMATAYDFMEAQLYIDSTYWYQWIDEPAGNWGINDGAGNPKLSYYEFVDRNTFVPSIPGDFDGDNAVTANDIDELFAHFGNPAYDLTGDNTANNLDVIHLVRVILGTEYGDADLDGDVDLHDFNRLALAFGTNGGWANGDFSGNGVINNTDLITLQTYFGFTAPQNTQAIPEPAALTLFTLALPALLTRQRSNSTLFR